MLTTNGTKYTFVCDPDECDTLIEVTCVSGFDFPNGVIKHTCPCGREMSYISATILTSEQQTKEEKVETIEKTLVEQRLEKLNDKFNKIEENLTEECWFNPNYEKSEILSDLCQILGITPSKTINFSGTMSFEGTIEVPLDELEDFDLQYLLQDEVYMTSNHGSLDINSYEVESVSQDY